VDAVRATGAIWLALGLLLLWAAGRIAGAQPGAMAAGILVLATAPVVLYQASIVSNDAAGVLVGSALALLALLSLSHPGRWRFPVLALAGAAAVLLKVCNVLGCLAAAAFLADAARHEAGGKFKAWLRRFWPGGGAVLIGSLLGAVAWMVVFRARTLIDPRTVPAYDVLRSTVRLSSIAREALLLLGPATDAYSPLVSDAAGATVGAPWLLELQTITRELTKVLLLAGGLGGLFVSRREAGHRLGLSSLPALYFGAILVGLVTARTFHIDPSLSGRHGLSVAPFLSLALVAGIRGAWLERALWAFALVSLAATLAGLWP
jgi:hypothetical protein